MAAIQVGLAPRRAGYYDRRLNLNLDYSNRVSTIEISESPEDAPRYAGIFQAVHCSPPVLVLIDGSFPEHVKAYCDNVHPLGKKISKTEAVKEEKQAPEKQVLFETETEEAPAENKTIVSTSLSEEKAEDEPEAETTSNETAIHEEKLPIRKAKGKK